MESFIVTCADAHGAVGPFATREEAGETAMKINAIARAKGGAHCDYVVAPFHIIPSNLLSILKAAFGAGVDNRLN